MLKKGKGTILFTGATASLRGSARFASLACPKFALRALSQSLAREFQPQVRSLLLTVVPCSGQPLPVADLLRAHISRLHIGITFTPTNRYRKALRA